MAAFKANSPVAAQGMNRNILDSQPNLFVKQTRKGWVQECFGCDANTEFKIATMQNQQENIMYATENTSCCIRFLCKNLRPFTITVSEGGQPGGKVHSFHERPCNLPLGNMKCCCYQQIVTKDSNGTVVGSVVEDCWYCVPSFKIINDSGMHEYNMHMPTCCCGMCVNCFSQGCCSCRLPFHFYVPGKEGEGEQVGEVVKIWSGLGKEILTDADNFELRFPTNADAACKTRLLGATFLVNQLFFER